MLDLFKINLQLFAEGEDGDASGDIVPPQEDDNTGGELPPDDTGDVTGTPKEGEPGVVDQRTSKQPPEVDAAFRRARLAEEELQKRDQQVAQKYGHLGINTYDQLLAALEKQEQRQAQETAEQKEEEIRQQLKQMEEDGYDVSAYYKMLEANPKIRQLEQMVQSMARQLEQQQTQEEQRKTDEAVNARVREIMQEHEQLRKEYGDLVPEKFEEMDPGTIERVRKGYSLTDAFEAANRDKIREYLKTSTKQKTLRQVGSKNHLSTEKPGAGDIDDTVEISPEKMRVWKQMGYSEAEARKRETKIQRQAKRG